MNPPSVAPAAALAEPAPRVAREAGLPRSHVPELDGVRALAIGLVLVAHLFFTWPARPESWAFLPGPVAGVLSHGWLGVDLFFVLSGFLITSILLRTKADGARAYFRRFYAHRAARILPLYLTVLAILFVFARGQYGAFFALCALMAANVATAIGVPVPDAAGPYWSLAVEEQFYLIWPWLVLKLDRRTLSWVALAVVAIEPIARLGARGHQLELTWFRADGLAIGAFIATWFADWNGEIRSARTLALGLLGAAMLVTLAAVPFGIFHESVASKSLRVTQAVLAFGSLVVVAIAYSGAPALGFLRSRFAVVTALLSYCLYLIHKPLSDAFEWAFARTPFATHLAPEPTLLVRIVCVLALAYGVAALSRRFLELPFIRLGANV